MPIGDLGNESWQKMPVDYLPIFYGGGTKLTERLRVTPKDALQLSRSGFELFLKSPRAFWMRWRHNLRESTPSPMMTLNTATGTLLEAFVGQLRTNKENGLSSTWDLFQSSPLELATPYIHPTDSGFVDRICGRPSGYITSRETALPYTRTGESKPAFTIYGELDEIFVIDNDGVEEIVIIDFKSKAKKFPDDKKGGKDVSELEEYRNFNYWNKIQLDFYAWHLRRYLDATGDSRPIHPIAYDIYVNLDPSEMANLKQTGSRIEFGFDSYIIPHKVRTDWIEPTLDLLVDCLYSTDVPSLQAIIGARGGRKEHHEGPYGLRYHWLWNYDQTIRGNDY